jgi:hypothetical protein
MTNSKTEEPTTMEYHTHSQNYTTLVKRTLATTLAALTLATSSGCMGVGKAFTTFGKTEDTIERKDEGKSERKEDNRKDEGKSDKPYAPPANKETYQDGKQEEKKNNDKQDEKKEPKRNIKPEFRVPAESCENTQSHYHTISYNTQRS